MDRQEYLNRLSADVRPAKKSGKTSGIFSSKIFLACLIGLVALIIIIIIGSILSGARGNEKTKTISLKLHLDNTESVIQTYQPIVKSSILRSSSASLSSVISNASSNLTNYLSEKYNYEDKNTPQNLIDQADLEKDGLESALYEAKINGNLDRIYAYKMAYEISMFLTEEKQIYNSTNDAALRDILEKAYNNMENLYSEFNNFSTTN